MPHDAYPLIRRRIKQAYGHLATVMEMMDQERSCADLAQQIEAIESTIRNAKRLLIRDHLEHCIIDAIFSGEMSKETAVEEFSALTKYL